MAFIKLSDRTVKSLSTDLLREDFYDNTFNHGGSFGLRVSASGKKVFFLIYRINGVRKRSTLGAYPIISLLDARKQAFEILGKVTAGKDPSEDKKKFKQAETFEELAEVYFKYHGEKLALSTQQDFRSMLKRDVLPRFGNKKAVAVTKADVIGLLDDIAHGRGKPIMANRTLEIVRRIFNYGISRDLIQINPAQGIEKPGRERKGERVLSREEIKLLWQVTENSQPHIRCIYRLLLLTGTRPKEVKSMQWSHIDGDVWTIPGEISKNRRKHQLFLSDLAKEELRMFSETCNGSKHIFPGIKPDQQVGEMREAHKKVLDSMKQLLAPKELERWTLRDTRRTVQTRMSEIGIRPDIVDRVLNHNIPGVRANYDHYNYFPEIRNALLAWDNTLQNIVKGE